MATLSDKQAQIMEFPFTGYDALICDGAVRSGKTSIMSLSFFLWAMSSFDRLRVCAVWEIGRSGVSETSGDAAARHDLSAAATSICGITGETTS